MRPVRVVLAALFVLALSSAAAQAADFCITQTGGLGLTYVGKGFAIPPKGKCKSWLGFTTITGATFISTGTGCTTSSGTKLHLGITTPAPIDGAGVVSDDIVLPLPLGTPGTDGQQVLNHGDVGTDSFTLTSAAGATCGVVPIP
jgi:hypothetical protein